MSQPRIRLRALETYVRSMTSAQGFWAEHFNLADDLFRPGTYQVGDVVWRLLPGAMPCGTRGPHGSLPAFAVDDFGQARGYLQAHDIPIVFEEILPGVSLLIFLDPDATPIELAQSTRAGEWDIADRRLLRSRQRQDEAPAGPLVLGALTELTLYTHDITASVRFYRDVLGLPVGLSFFGHVHLVMENVPLVLRGTNWHCKHPHDAHATEPVFGVDDLNALATGCREAGYPPYSVSDHRISVREPAGWRIHFESNESSN